MRKNFVAAGVGLATGIVVIAGFRFPICSVRESRPKLTILQSMEPYAGCSFGTNYTKIRNTASLELKISASQAIKSADSELRAQGYQRLPSKGSGTVYRREFDNGRVAVVFREPYVGKPAQVIISVGLFKVLWYGMPVPSWF